MRQRAVQEREQEQKDQDQGVTTAYNLDGGGSSTMYLGSEVVNNPTANGKSTQERNVSDIVYV